MATPSHVTIRVIIMMIILIKMSTHQKRSIQLTGGNLHKFDCSRTNIAYAMANEIKKSKEIHGQVL